MGNYYVGLDAGSTYLKAALIKDNRVLSHFSKVIHICQTT